MDRVEATKLLWVYRDSTGSRMSITDPVIDIYHSILCNYDFDTGKDIITRYCVDSDKFISPYNLKTFIAALEAGDDVDDSCENNNQRDRAWQSTKFTNNDMIRETVKAIKDNTLTDIQKHTMKTIDGYMKHRFGEEWYNKIDYKDNNQRLNPLTASFVGLYIDAARGKLKPLTGIKRGDIIANIPI